jgi:hypothetical protein
VNDREEPQTGSRLTSYDREHATIYLRLLDADAAGASWQDAVRHIFNQDPDLDSSRCERMHANHLARAKWLRDGGYLQLLAQPAG